MDDEEGLINSALAVVQSQANSGFDSMLKQLIIAVPFQRLMLLVIIIEEVFWGYRNLYATTFQLYGYSSCEISSDVSIYHLRGCKKNYKKNLE